MADGSGRVGAGGAHLEDPPVGAVVHSHFVYNLTDNAKTQKFTDPRTADQ